MIKNLKQTNTKETILYNKILSLSRNKLFYTKFDLNDTFENRIHLIFLHVSFLFIKIKKSKQNKTSVKFNRGLFDRRFKQIKLNRREEG